MTRADLYAWLDAHPAAWHGWPTTSAIDAQECKARIDRLQQHGCPFIGHEGLIWEVGEQVRILRLDKAAEYRRAVERAL